MTEENQADQPNDCGVGINVVVLLPCPFCGKPPSVDREWGVLDANDAIDFECRIECVNDECLSESGCQGADYEDAVRRWNTRKDYRKVAKMLVESISDLYWATDVRSSMVDEIDSPAQAFMAIEVLRSEFA